MLVTNGAGGSSTGVNILSCQTLPSGVCVSLGQVAPLREVSRLRGTLTPEHRDPTNI